jgi:hypothetical protein
MEKVYPASFGYLTPLNLYEIEKPYLSRLPALPGFDRTNIVGQNQPVPIHEVSGHENLFKLDECGFEFVNIPGELKQWSESSICVDYMPILKRWLKDHIGCEDVYIYAYSVSQYHYRRCFWSNRPPSSEATTTGKVRIRLGRLLSSERIVVLPLQIRP